MPGPILCGHVSAAPLLPRLRGHFAEFLDNASSAGLGILSPSTCVGLRYGCSVSNSGFSRRWARALRYLSSLRVACPAHWGGFSIPGLPCLHRSSLSRRAPRPPRPRSSVTSQCRNLHLLSIGCASLPRLRPRLTQGRSALPWKPWIFGRGDSHPTLATHSGILPSRPSTAPRGRGFLGRGIAPLPILSDPRASVACFSPGHFRRGASRLVSCYALFECVAASEPTS